ncbi:MAG: hypothetical protein J6J23_03200 [Clostridia bacterium]|nr:hypothetical protein [Clostridia bacterium]
MKTVEVGFKEKRKIDLSEIVLFTILGLLFALMTTMIVMSFVAVGTQTKNIFSSELIKNYIFILLTAVALILVDIAIQKGRLYAKNWVFSVIYIIIFILLNLLNIFNLYRYFVINLMANILIGAFFTLIGVSIYYNYLKNENNKVKAKAIMVVLFAFVFTIACSFLMEVVKWLVGIIFNSEPTTFAKIALNVIYSTIGSVLLNLVFYLSLIGKKVVVNACLIDVSRVE